MFFRPEHIQRMLQLQHACNLQVDPDYLTGSYPFLPMGSMKLALGAHPPTCPWTQRTSRSGVTAQAHLVDYWRFVLSHLLVQAGGDIEEASAHLCWLCGGNPGQRHPGAPATGLVTTRIRFDGHDHELTHMTAVERIELLVGLSVARRIDLLLLDSVLEDFHMSWHDLYRLYMGNCMLDGIQRRNRRAQEDDIRIWGCGESHSYLVKVASHLPVDDADFEMRLYLAVSTGTRPEMDLAS